MQTTESLVGMTIAGYLLTAQLSSNSYSHTYLGEMSGDAEQKRTVALKHFHARPLSSLASQQQFLREAQLFQELKHPYILPIVAYGIEEARSTPYIINDFAPFRSLHNRILRQWPQPFLLNEALTIITRIGEALAYAHEHKIVHGNLTPHSILFNANNEALLTDFDIISLRSDSLSDTSNSQVSDANSMQGDLHALVSIFATILSSGQTTASSASGRPISSPGNWLPQARVTLPASVPEHIQTAINRVLDAESQQGFDSVQDFLAAIEISVTLEKEVKSNSISSNTFSEMISPLSSTPTGSSGNVAKQETQKGAEPRKNTRPITSPPISRSTTTQDQPSRITTPSSPLRTQASGKEPSRATRPLSPAQAAKSSPTPSLTREPVIPPPIQPLFGDSDYAQATQKQQPPNEQSVKQADILQTVPVAPLAPPKRRRSPFILVATIVVLVCICVTTLIYAIQRPDTSTQSSLQSLATAVQQQTSTSTIPGADPTSKLTRTTGNPEQTPEARSTPKPGQAPPSQEKSTPTTSNPVTKPTSTASTPTQAPAVFYSFEGSFEGWSNDACTLQISSGYAYAGTYSLQANIGSRSYAYVYGTLSQGQIVTVHVYVPAGSPSVSANVSIGDSSDVWDDASPVGLTAGQWNSVSYALSKKLSGTLRIGLDMYATGNTSVYIDAVSWG